jgi:hypothetical protein
MKLDGVMANMMQKFKSSNGIPVMNASITAEEFEVIKEFFFSFNALVKSTVNSGPPRP